MRARAFWVKEIADAELRSANEDEDLSRSEDVLADAVAHREALYAAASALQDDDGASDVVGRSIAAISHRETFAMFAERLKNVQAEIDDVAREMRDVAESIEENPTWRAVVTSTPGNVACARQTTGATGQLQLKCS